MKKLFIASILFCSAASFANLIGNNAFENTAQWRGVDGKKITIRRGDGRNGSGGLACDLAKGERKLISSELAEKPQTGVTYKYGAWIRCTEGMAARPCIEVNKQGKYFYGAYSAPDVKGPADWTYVESTFSTRGEDPSLHRYRMTLIANAPNQPGKIYFDDVQMIPDVPEWFLTQVHPTHRVVPVQGGKVRLSSSFSGPYLPEKAKISVVAELLPDQRAVPARFFADRIELEFPPLTAGPRQLRVTLSANGKELGAKLLPLMVRIQPASKSHIDGKGRAIVDGKPFLPIGLYLSEYKKEHIDRIGKSNAFNTVLTYPVLRFPTLDGTQKYFDHCHAQNLKVIFNIIDLHTRNQAGELRYDRTNMQSLRPAAKQIIDRFRNHPALLAYYIDDESSVAEIKELEARRNITNELDPAHPTWAVYYQTDDFARYLPALDILGYDPYPIVPDGRLLTTDMTAVAAEKLTVPLWVAPQIFNWGCYDKAARKELKLYRTPKFREPAEQEMTSLVVLEAIRGARGFIFYNYTDLYRNPDPTELERRWPDVVSVAAKLAALAPYLLSDIPAKPVRIIQNRGTTRAQLFTAPDGTVRLLIAGLDHDNEAELILPRPMKLKSTTYNNIRQIAPDRLRFAGKAFSCDIAGLE